MSFNKREDFYAKIRPESKEIAEDFFLNLKGGVTKDYKKRENGTWIVFG